MAADLNGAAAALLYRTGTPKDYPLWGTEASVGYDSGNPVRVAIEGVSRRHAKITYDGQDYFIEDAGSSNGTFLNGIPVVRRERLRHLDIVGLGRRTELVFVRKAVGARRTRRRGIVQVWLQTVDGPDAGERREIPRGLITMGRAPSNNVVVRSELVSKAHARIERLGVELILTDLQSANGTFVNGKAITTRTLEDGDEINLGKARTFRVQVQQGEIETHEINAAPSIDSTGAGLPTDWKTRLEWSPEELAAFEWARSEGAQAAAEPEKAKEDGKGKAAAAGPSRAKAAGKPAPEGQARAGQEPAPQKPPAKPAAKPAAGAAQKPAEKPPEKPGLKPPERSIPKPAEKPAPKPSEPEPALAPEAKVGEAAPAAPAPSPPNVQPPSPLPAPAVSRSGVETPGVGSKAPGLEAPAAVPAVPGAPPAAPAPAAPSPARPVTRSAAVLPPPRPSASAPPISGRSEQTIQVRLPPPVPAPLVAVGTGEPRVFLDGKLHSFSFAAGDHDVGRVAECAVRLESPQISRRHAVLHVTADEVLIEDLKSANGTFVNGKRVTDRHTLDDGDELRFGDLRFQVRVKSDKGLPQA